MAAQDFAKLFEVPGRFCKGPTDLTLPFPHGGTAMGYSSEVSFKPVVYYDLILGEEKGESAVEIIETEGTGTLAFTLRQWDNATLSEVFPSTETRGDEEAITFPGAYQRAMAATGIVLLFSPLDPRQPGIICKRAVPALQETAALNMNLSTPLNVGCVFFLLEGSGGACEIVTLGEMTAL